MGLTVTARSGAARRGELVTPHGTVQTPLFMNVATCGAIKGALSAVDLAQLGCQVMLCNTYHLHLRPGDDLIFRRGGIRKFTGWSGPVLTDSGGFQVFSLARLRQISEEGVAFSSHIDGRPLFIGPEESMRIQSHLGSTVAMAFDECVANPADYAYAAASASRTTRWLYRCREELSRLNGSETALNREQWLFGINQGSIYTDIRVSQMKDIVSLDLSGYAIGGLAVGEPAETMYQIIEEVEPFMPADRPRYLMGVGTPVNILEGVYRGIDLFDCVLPTRNARHAHVFTWEGRRNLLNSKYAEDDRPIDESCACPVCRRHSRAYIRHLFKAGEMLALRLCVAHNLFFYNTLMQRIRLALDTETFPSFYREYRQQLDRRI